MNPDEFVGPLRLCETDPGEFDHDWKCVDDSFDHEYGTQQGHHWECRTCGEFKESEPGDLDDDYDDFGYLE